MDTSKSQLRQQLLASENSLPDASGFNNRGFVANSRQQTPGAPRTSSFTGLQPGMYPAMNYTGQYQMHERYTNNSQMGGYNQGQVSNHDLVTPILESAGQSTSQSTSQSASQSGGGSSRKASMNSLSMQKLFRRKGNEDGQFDEDLGVDLGEVPYADMSFNDIKHLRGSGRYNTSPGASIDTAPIIPIVSMPGADGIKSLNNVQYRKFMNHQKKLNLAYNARAMSLASGGNPMANQDPRSMSFTNNTENRANSLGNVLNGGPNPRAMSLNYNPNLRGPQAPSSGHMYPQGPMPGPMPGPMHSRAIGKNHQYHQTHANQTYPPQQGAHFPGRPGFTPPMQMPASGNPQLAHQASNHTMSLRTGAQQFNSSQDPRSNSLNSNNIPMAPGMSGPPGQRMQSLGNGQGHPGVSNLAPPALHHNRPQLRIPGLESAQYLPSSRPIGTHPIGASNESLTNVMEEEEEDEYVPTSNINISKHSDTSVGFSSPANAQSDENHINKFKDQENRQSSIKSTMKNSNSMRLRKLDIFNKKDGNLEETKSAHNEVSGSSGNTGDSAGREPHNNESSDNLNRCDNNENQTNTADKEIPIISFGMKPATTESRIDQYQTTSSPLKLKNLTENTAFSKMPTRNLVSEAEAEAKADDSTPTVDQFDSSSRSSEHENATSTDTYNADHSFDGPADRHFKGMSDLQSNISDYSADSLKKPEPSPTQESVFFKTRHLTSMDWMADRKDPQLPQDIYDVTKGLMASSISPNTPTSPKTKIGSSLSRKNSEFNAQDLAPRGALLNVNTQAIVSPSQDVEVDGKERRKSTSSITSKSRKLIKRLSFTNAKKVARDNLDSENQKNNKSRVSSVSSSKTNKPLLFTKEELAIMTCNSELQSELLSMTSELAHSIKRELALEARLKSRSGRNDVNGSRVSVLSKETETAQVIVELQEKLNRERTLRFISEEHAILAEHGQAPSSLKLDYEKNEIYNQLLAKNELVTQLQDKLNEMMVSNTDTFGNDLVLRFDELLKENFELKAKVQRCKCLSNSDSKSQNADEDRNGMYSESDQAVILSLKTQRDELREMITKLSASRNAESKAYQEKVKILEVKLEKMNAINHKLSERLRKPASTSANGEGKFSNGQGGKLLGLSIVSSSQNLFDD